MKHEIRRIVSLVALAAASPLAGCSDEASLPQIIPVPPIVDAGPALPAACTPSAAASLVVSASQLAGLSMRQLQVKDGHIFALATPPGSSASSVYAIAPDGVTASTPLVRSGVDQFWLDKSDVLYRIGSRVFAKPASGIGGTDLCNFGFTAKETTFPIFAIDDTYFYRVVAVPEDEIAVGRHEQRIERMHRSSGCLPATVDTVFSTIVDDTFPATDFTPLAVAAISTAGKMVYVHLATPSAAIAAGYKQTSRIVAIAEDLTPTDLLPPSTSAGAQIFTSDARGVYVEDTAGLFQLAGQSPINVWPSDDAISLEQVMTNDAHRLIRGTFTSGSRAPYAFVGRLPGSAADMAPIFCTPAAADGDDTLSAIDGDDLYVTRDGGITRLPL